MRNTRSILSIFVAGLVIPALTGVARADFTPTQTASIPLTQTNWDSTTPSVAGVDPLTFQQFNAAQYSQNGLTAVLTSVQLTLNYTFDNTLTMRFDNVSTITVTASGTMGLTLPGGTNLLPTTPTFTHSETLSATPSDVFSKYVTLPLTPPATGTVNGTYTDSATLSQFTGTGTISLPAFANATSSFTSSSGNGYGSSVTYASATVGIVYFYTLAPEPSSFVLMGLGVVGLVAVACRRSRDGLKVRDKT